MKSHSNGLCFGTDLDLVVINAQTNDCFVDDMLIPNNNRVLIRRIPGTRHGKPVDTATIVVIEKQQPLSSSYRTGSSNTETVVTASSRSTPVNTGVSSVSASTITSLSSTKCSGDASFGYDDGFGDDVFVIPRMKPAQSSMTSVDVESDEDSKIKALVNTPALDWRLEANVLADSLIPNMTLRDTINCFVESSCGNSSSSENAKSNSFRVMDVESALCSQPQISQKKLPAGSFQESKKTTLDK
ncbi:hypothetical protein GH714_028306 [Hevea brasiliensis]|uniref:DWNN domain-containing protein n=1 Tax=Hevea brasiliensis TaxID=3981 RepID=A0A6A6LRU7_HEVBR|nr:hypothetical protein GH714_028306 [Hevea brasiliensis]